MARGKTVARLLNSFSAGGQRFHTTKAMSDVRTEPFDRGYAELWCLNGDHTYTLGRCIHCDRKDHTVEYKPVTD